MQAAFRMMSDSRRSAPGSKWVRSYSIMSPHESSKIVHTHTSKNPLEVKRRAQRRALVREKAKLELPQFSPRPLKKDLKGMK